MMKLWNDWFEAARFGYEAQCVIAMRMMRLAAGGTRGGSEAQRMVTEKVAALMAAQTAAAAALVTGRTATVAARRALTPVKRRVRANRRRLAKGSGRG
jgi:hypothetical protein